MEKSMIKAFIALIILRLLSAQVSAAPLKNVWRGGETSCKENEPFFFGINRLTGGKFRAQVSSKWFP